MDTIQRQVRRARFRLGLEQFVQRFLWCAFWAFVVATIAIAIPKVFVVNALPAQWNLIWLVGSGVIALVVSLAWTFFSHRSEMEAAVELDLRYGLKERVASSLFLEAEDLETRAGKALVEDAIRRVERIEVSEHFRLGLGRRPWLPLVPAIAAFLVIAFLNNRIDTNQAQASQNKLQLTKQVKQSAKTLQKKIEKKKKEAIAKGLKDAAGLFKDIEKQAKKLSDKDKPDRNKAVVKLNDLAKQLEQRRNKIGGEKSLKKQFENLKKMGKGPADKVAEAMKKGDFKKAMNELDKLGKKLAENKLNEKEKKQLQKQMQKMQEKLNDAANANKQAMDKLKQEIKKQQQQGNNQAAAKMQEKLDQMQQNKPQMDALKKLADKLGQCQKCMKQGDQKGAQQAMKQMKGQLADMQKQLDEMKMLDDMMDQINEAKNQMGCKQCKAGKDGQGNKAGKKGKGWGGKGEGNGLAQDEENDVKFRDSHVGQKINKGGKAVITGLADGKNIRGKVTEAVKEAMEVGKQEAPDPLASERLPRSRREQAEEYFNAIRGED